MENILNLVKYIIAHNIFDVFVRSNCLENTNVPQNTDVPEDEIIYIVVQSIKPKMKTLLQHIGKYQAIKSDDEIIGEQCSICFGEYQAKEYKRTLGKCGHTFHKKCIDKWFVKKKHDMDCPLCRTNYNRYIYIQFDDDAENDSDLDTDPDSDPNDISSNLNEDIIKTD